jgi:hypothetical protein
MNGQVNDANVQLIITAALNAVPPEPGDTVVDRTRKAFRVLQKRRRTLEPLNIDLAAAEHYMYVRFLAGRTGDPLVTLAPTGYGIKKRVFFLFGIQDRMATTAHPVLPPNDDVEKWGKRGAEAGMQDFELVNPGKERNYGGALKALRQEALRYN